MVTSVISVIAASQHPVPALFWAVPDLMLSMVRIPLVLYMMRFLRRKECGRTLEPWIIDLFVGLGILWSALLGLGALLCLATNDPGLSILVVLMAMGTIGAQSVRRPASPRLNIVQMCSIVAPTWIGLAISAIPLTGWAAALIPLYLFGMINITRRLHDDYVAMIVARIENWSHAVHCSLTGLPNRSNFDATLADALAEARMTGTPVALLCLDLDGFKAVNDGLGHPIGDLLLKQVADRLRDLPEQAAPARLGGDEFAVVLPECGEAEAETIARRLIDAIGRPYDLNTGPSVRIGVSIGIAASDGDADAACLVARADQALYAAKRAGRGTFRRYDADRAARAATLGGDTPAIVEPLSAIQNAA